MTFAFLSMCRCEYFSSIAYRQVYMSKGSTIEIKGDSLIFIPFSTNGWFGKAYINSDIINLGNGNYSLLDFGSSEGKIIIQSTKNFTFQYSVIPARALYLEQGANIFVQTVDKTYYYDKFDCIILSSPYKFYSPNECYYLAEDGTMKIGKDIFSEIIIIKRYDTNAEALITDTRLLNIQSCYQRKNIPFEIKDQPRLSQSITLHPRASKRIGSFNLLIYDDVRINTYYRTNYVLYFKEIGKLYPGYYYRKPTIQLFSFTYSNNIYYNGTDGEEAHAILNCVGLSKSLAVIDSEGKYDLSIENLISVPIEGEYLVKGISKEAIIYTDGININNEKFTKPIIISCSGCEIEVISKIHNNFTGLIYKSDEISSNNHGNFTFYFSEAEKRAILPKNSTIIIKNVIGIVLRGSAQITIFGDSKVYINQNPTVYRCSENITVRTGDHKVDIISLAKSSYYYMDEEIRVVIGSEINFEFDGKIDSFFSSFEGSLTIAEISNSSSYSSNSYYNQEVLQLNGNSNGKQIIQGYLFQSELQLDTPKYQMVAELGIEEFSKELHKIIISSTYSIGNSMIRRRMMNGESFELTIREKIHFIHVHNIDGYEVTGTHKKNGNTYEYTTQNPRIIQINEGSSILTFKALKNIDLILSIYKYTYSDKIIITNEVNKILTSTRYNSIIFSMPGKSVLEFYTSGSYFYYVNETGSNYINDKSGNFTSYMHMIDSHKYGITAHITSLVKEWEVEPFTKTLKYCDDFCYDDFSVVKHHDDWVLAVTLYSIGGSVLGIVIIILTIIFVRKYLKKKKAQLTNISSLIGNESDFTVWTEHDNNSNWQ